MSLHFECLCVCLCGTLLFLLVLHIFTRHVFQCPFLLVSGTFLFLLVSSVFNRYVNSFCTFACFWEVLPVCPNLVALADVTCS